MLMPEEEQRRAALIQSGLRIGQVAKMMGCSVDAIRKWAKKRGYYVPAKDGFHRGRRGEQERQAEQLSEEKQARAENMRRLTEDDRAAKEAGLTYGKWRALQNRENY